MTDLIFHLAKHPWLALVIELAVLYGLFVIFSAAWNLAGLVVFLLGAGANLWIAERVHRIRRDLRDMDLL